MMYKILYFENNDQTFQNIIIICLISQLIFLISSDTEAELGLIKKLALEAGASDAVICSHWAKGGSGAVQLAEAVAKASSQPSDFK